MSTPPIDTTAPTDPYTGEPVSFGGEQPFLLEPRPLYDAYLARCGRYARLKTIARIEEERATFAPEGERWDHLRKLVDEDLAKLRAELDPMTPEDEEALAREQVAYRAALAALGRVPEMTDKEATDRVFVVDSSGPVVALYHLRRRMGDKPSDAANFVLTALVQGRAAVRTVRALRATLPDR